jgi:hypothetical protein
VRQRLEIDPAVLSRVRKDWRAPAIAFGLNMRYLCYQLHQLGESAGWHQPKKLCVQSKIQRLFQEPRLATPRFTDMIDSPKG